MSISKSSILITSLVGLLLHTEIFACSRVVENNLGNEILVGRSMDWFEPMHTQLWILPRGMERNGEAGKNSLKWTSRYGSIATTVYGGATADGMNEKGLTASILYLSESNFGKPKDDQPGLSLALWGQYFLDNYESVNEALEGIKQHPFQPRMASVGVSAQKPATVHLAITDKTGDTAVIEYINGEMTVHHGKEYTIMTNSPPYNEQLENLKKYKGFGGEAALPGTTEAADRFVRAAYYSQHLPKPKNSREAVAGVLSVMRNVSQPFGVADPNRPNISETQWRTVADLTDGIFYYESVLSPNIIWVNLKEVDFKKGASPQVLKLDSHPDYVGNVSKKFEKATMFKFIPAANP